SIGRILEVCDLQTTRGDQVIWVREERLRHSYAKAKYTPSQIFVHAPWPMEAGCHVPPLKEFWRGMQSSSRARKRVPNETIPF
ncbi:hypothetical protein KC19_VG118200, partial [Ceratodon purpureus]